MSEKSKRSETVGDLIDQAFTWLQQPENEMWVEAGSMGFFDVTYEYQDWARQWLMTLFPTWLLFDHRGPDGRTGLERFEARFRDRIPKADRKLLQRVKRERFRFTEVEAVTAGEGITLRDLTSEEALEVRDTRAAEKLQPGTTCFVRLRRFGGKLEIDALAVLPQSLRDALRLRIAGLIDELRGESELTEEDLFRTAAPRIFNLAIRLADEFAPPTEVQQLPEAERKILEKAIVDHFDRWVETPVETLGNKTPRQAAEDPALRPELLTLLRELEQRAAEDSKFPLDIGLLRDKLGLDRDE